MAFSLYHFQSNGRSFQLGAFTNYREQRFSIFLSDYLLTPYQLKTRTLHRKTLLLQPRQQSQVKTLHSPTSSPVFFSETVVPSIPIPHPSISFPINSTQHLHHLPPTFLPLLYHPHKAQAHFQPLIGPSGPRTSISPQRFLPGHFLLHFPSWWKNLLGQARGSRDSSRSTFSKTASTGSSDLLVAPAPQGHAQPTVGPLGNCTRMHCFLPGHLRLQVSLFAKTFPGQARGSRDSSLGTTLPAPSSMASIDLLAAPAPQGHAQPTVGPLGNCTRVHAFWPGHFRLQVALFENTFPGQRAASALATMPSAAEAASWGMLVTRTAPARTRGRRNFMV